MPETYKTTELTSCAFSVIEKLQHTANHLLRVSNSLNMKTNTVLISLLLAICFLSGEVFAEDKYTTKYDDVDINAILNSERLLNGYVNCLLDRGSCTPDAAELKKNLPDALEHQCSACSEKQKQIADRLSQYLIDNREEDWSLLEAKYDPTGAYRQHYLQNRLKDKAID